MSWAPMVLDGSIEYLQESNGVLEQRQGLGLHGWLEAHCGNREEETGPFIWLELERTGASVRRHLKRGNREEHSKITSFEKPELFI